ncbi:MAG: pectate lyase [Melioribacteraceae bacterium]|nr:pectate lyase [Melioribacteraceae bacterium]
MKSKSFRNLLLLLAILILFPILSFGQNSFNKIDVSGFDNSARHWYNINSDDNIIEPLPGKPRYSPNQILEIADNILLFQKKNGGWAKNYDMLAILSEEQKSKVTEAKSEQNTTYDNWTTHTHIHYLAQVYAVTRNDKYKEACINGINFVINSQYKNGGWPQYYPPSKGYDKHITFNDGVMSGILTLLNNIVQKLPIYSFVDSTLYNKVRDSYLLGLDCVLKCQIRQNGQLTVWGQQHDFETLEPTWARAFEPPSICNGESSDLVLFLMNLENPNQRIIDAINGAVQWFEKSKIYNLKLKTIRTEPVKYQNSTVTRDVIAVEDFDAPPIWARYYELETHRPLFCNRDKIVVYSLAEVHPERRAGYAWYTNEPKEVLKKYPEWQERWSPNFNALK